MAERLKATDCKSVLSRVRRFEPYSAHFLHRSFNKVEVLYIVFKTLAGVAHLVER
jgi:hypothetical protein